MKHAVSVVIFILGATFSAAAQDEKNYNNKERAILEIANKSIISHYELGNFEEALSLSRSLYNISKDVDYLKEFSVIAMGNIASIHMAKGNLQEAERIMKNVLDQNISLHGENDPTTLVYMNNLASLYKQQGNYIEAEKMFESVLGKNQFTLGDSHPSTISSMNNLALLYSQAGRFDDANDLLQSAINNSKLTFGDNHPKTLSIANNLASNYIRQGAYADAQPLIVDALNKTRESLGENHPSTLNLINNLASTYVKQGRYDDAEPLFLKAIDISKAVLGESHPSTLSIMSNIAALYEKQGRYKSAINVNEETAYFRLDSLGAEHPSTIGSIEKVSFLKKEHRRLDIDLVSRQKNKRGPWGDSPEKLARQIEESVFAKINDIRERDKLEALEVSNSISELARIYAEDMILGDFFGHFTIHGEDLADRLAKVKLDHLSSVAEILWDTKELKVWSYGSLSDLALKDWMNSIHGHKQAILDKNFEVGGVGVAFSEERLVVVSIFAEK